MTDDTDTQSSIALICCASDRYHVPRVKSRLEKCGFFLDAPLHQVPDSILVLASKNLWKDRELLERLAGVDNRVHTIYWASLDAAPVPGSLLALRDRAVLIGNDPPDLSRGRLRVHTSLVGLVFVSSFGIVGHLVGRWRTPPPAEVENIPSSSNAALKYANSVASLIDAYDAFFAIEAFATEREYRQAVGNLTVPIKQVNAAHRLFEDDRNLLRLQQLATQGGAHAWKNSEHLICAVRRTQWAYVRLRLNNEVLLPLLGPFYRRENPLPEAGKKNAAFVQLKGRWPRVRDGLEAHVQTLKKDAERSK